jgi:hypothetical protein
MLKVNPNPLAFSGGKSPEGTAHFIHVILPESLLDMAASTSVPPLYKRVFLVPFAG